MSSRAELVEKTAMELIELLAQFRRVPPQTHSKTQLYGELGLAGDDADEFLSAVDFKYDNCLSKNKFETWKYFPDEGAMILGWPFKLLNFWPF